MNPFSRDRTDAIQNPTSLREGDYVTDQRGLYRVLHVLVASRRSAAAILEDCRTLDLVALATRDPTSVGLQVVRPAAAG